MRKGDEDKSLLSLRTAAHDLQLPATTACQKRVSGAVYVRTDLRPGVVDISWQSSE
jgi:hypothetical protein